MRKQEKQTLKEMIDNCIVGVENGDTDLAVWRLKLLRIYVNQAETQPMKQYVPKGKKDATKNAKQLKMKPGKRE